MIPRVSVLLPVHRDEGLLAGAFGSVVAQRGVEPEILLILNAADEPTTRTALALAERHPRTRVLERPTPSLAAGLNDGLRAASHGLVARMDADDTCHPDRLARQAAYLAAHPTVAALGTAYERLAPDGRVLDVVTPPTDPREVRWRLLLDNVLCHGSVMLRRDVVLALGGYDERCERAQDYDLWLRLSRAASIANLPDVLYAYRVRDADAPSANSDAQAHVAAGALLDAFEALPPSPAPSPARDDLRDALAGVIARRQDALPALESLLTRDGPTRAGLFAYLLALERAAADARAGDGLCRAARLREVGAALRARGVPGVHLWGAGRHAGWILARRADLGVPVLGLIDDACAGDTRHGFVVRSAAALAPGDHALISSDRHERAIWASSAPHRARGLHVWRLYAEHAA